MSNNPFPLPKEKLLEAYTKMKTIREFEERLHAEVDKAITLYGPLEAFLTQKKAERATLGAGYAELKKILDAGGTKGNVK